MSRTYATHNGAFYLSASDVPTPEVLEALGLSEAYAEVQALNLQASIIASDWQKTGREIVSKRNRRDVTAAELDALQVEHHRQETEALALARKAQRILDKIDRVILSTGRAVYAQIAADADARAREAWDAFQAAFDLREEAYAKAGRPGSGYDVLTSKTNGLDVTLASGHWLVGGDRVNPGDVGKARTTLAKVVANFPGEACRDLAEGADETEETSA